MTRVRYEPGKAVKIAQVYEEGVCINCGGNVRRPKGGKVWSHGGLVERCGLPSGEKVIGYSFRVGRV